MTWLLIPFAGVPLLIFLWALISALLPHHVPTDDELCDEIVERFRQANKYPGDDPARWPR